MIQELFANPKKSKGQILVMYALILLVLIAVMGLAIDVGYVYVSYARLRRAVDAAALNASNQIKEGYEHEDLEAAAVEFLHLNGIDVDASDPNSVEVHTCETDASRLSDCPPVGDPKPARKLVSVWAAWDVPTFFMSVLGFDTIRISASAESEAATVDIILVIDVSESMTKDAPDYTPLRDPWLCSELNACQPFEQVKSAAADFIDQLYFPYDRVGIVAFGRHADTVLELTNEKQDILDAIESLRVYSGEPCKFFYEADFPGEVQLADSESFCRLYRQSDGADDSFLPGGARWSTPAGPADQTNWPFNEMLCPQTVLANAGVPLMYGKRGHCNSTNMGAGLRLGGNMLARGSKYEKGHPLEDQEVPIAQRSREESMWVVIVLADGIANIAYSGTILCPNPDTFCRQDKPGTRYSLDPLVDPAIAKYDKDKYDPVDYAFDMADFLYGMEVYTFGIGLGPDVDNATAVELMNYVIAPTGHKEYQAPPRGVYYVAPDANELRAIFLKIANNIATRITQ